MDYLKCHENFKEKLKKELDKMIAGEKKNLEIKNISSGKFCEVTGCEANDFNGWQCDWWGNFQYKGHKFGVGGCAWYGTIGVNLER